MQGEWIRQRLSSWEAQEGRAARTGEGARRGEESWEVLNPRDYRHVEEAIVEVRDVLSVSWQGMSDVELVERIEANAVELRAAEQRGDAETAHERSKKIAAMAIEYMARGLA